MGPTGTENRRTPKVPDSRVGPVIGLALLRRFEAIWFRRFLSWTYDMLLSIKHGRRPDNLEKWSTVNRT